MPACLTFSARCLCLGIASLVTALALHSEVVDRIAAIVGSEAITVSEIEVELRLEAMLNRIEVGSSAHSRRDALRRLIDRHLIDLDLLRTPFLRPGVDEVAEQVDQLRDQEYLGGRSFQAALLHYRLTEADLQSFLEERIAFERYVAFRFRTGVEAESAEIEAYYRNEYSRQRLDQGEPVPSLATVRDSIARIIVERRANDQLGQRLMELRTQIRIESKLAPENHAGP